MKKDIWFTFSILRADATDRGMSDLALVYHKSAVRMGFELLRKRRYVYQQMDRDLGDMIK
jgi:hypothetical protein